MRRVALAIAALLAIALVPVVTSAAPGSGAGGRSDIREFDRKARRELVVSKQATREIERSAASLPGPKAPPVVGEERFWLGLDETRATTPRRTPCAAIGTNLEVWVASDEDDVSTGTEFPAGDCRNDGERNVDHRRAGRVPDRRVRQQHVSDRVGRVQRRASSQRRRGHPGEDPRAAVRLLPRPGRPDRRAHRQRAGRQLLRHRQRERVHRTWPGSTSRSTTTCSTDS